MTIWFFLSVLEHSFATLRRGLVKFASANLTQNS